MFDVTINRIASRAMSRRHRGTGPRARRACLRLEALEERLVLSSGRTEHLHTHLVSHAAGAPQIADHNLVGPEAARRVLSSRRHGSHSHKKHQGHRGPKHPAPTAPKSPGSDLGGLFKPPPTTEHGGGTVGNQPPNGSGPPIGNWPPNGSPGPVGTQSGNGNLFGPETARRALSSHRHGSHSHKKHQSRGGPRHPAPKMPTSTGGSLGGLFKPPPTTEHGGGTVGTLPPNGGGTVGY
jgi:hypothetical protein